MNSTEVERKKKERRFVVHYYREHTFDAKKAYENIRRRAGQPEKHLPWGVRRWIAAAASVAVLTVMARLAGYRYIAAPQGPVPVAEEVAVPQAGGTVESIAADGRFHFTATPLPEVLRQLEQFYGVGLAADDTTHSLTGVLDALSLSRNIEVIEEVLGVKIAVE